METPVETPNRVPEKTRLGRGYTGSATDKLSLSGIDIEDNRDFGRLCYAIRKSKNQVTKELIKSFIEHNQELVNALKKAEAEYDKTLAKSTANVAA